MVKPSNSDGASGAGSWTRSLRAPPRSLWLLACVLGALPAAAQEPLRYDIERFRLKDVEEAADTGAPLDLHFFGRSHRIALERAELRSSRFKLQGGSLDGLRRITPSVGKTFKGHLVDEPESLVRISVTSDGLRAYLRSSEGWTFIEPLERGFERGAARMGAGAPAHKVFTDGDIDMRFMGTCAELPAPGENELEPARPVSGHPDKAAGAEGEVILSEEPADGSMETGAEPVPPALEAGLRVLELAVDADVEFFSVHGADSVAEIESVLNIVDGIYQAELGITVRLVSVNVWEAEPDPYTSTSSSTLLSELRSYWNANNDAVARDATHLFTGKELDGSTVGIAYVSVVCSKTVAYGLSQDLGSEALMPLLVAHEMGHNLGSGHDPTDSPVRYIMYPSLGFLNLDEFSDTSKADIGSYVNGVGCLSLEDGGAPGQPPAPNGGGSSGGGGGGGGGGGPIDPFLIALLGAGAWGLGRMRRRQ